MTADARPQAPVPIDVVITSHNYAPYLPAAIDSALAQTHPDVRVVVVDDGSTDASPAIIASYGDRVVPVLKANAGQASAFNAGLAAVEGDVVMFLDADDILVPEIAARVADTVSANPDAAKVQWRMELAGADGRPTGATVPSAHVPMPSGDMRRAEVTFPFDIAWMATSGNAFPTRILRQILPMPERDYRVNADWYLQHLTPLLGPVVSLEEVGAIRRLHGANAYEQDATAELDLAHVRETIRTAAVTRAAIERLADERRIPRAPGPILSVSELANRMISLRLDRRAHPVPGDRRRALVTDGTRAALRRDDVRAPMRAAFVAWFTVMAIAPRALARPIGRLFLFPEQRRGANRLLRNLHRRGGPGDPA